MCLNGARTVRVRARDSAGKPVSRVEIVPWLVKKPGKLSSVNLCGSSAKVRTDEQGLATFDWFPSDAESGASFILATAEYSLPKWPTLDAGKQDVELTVLRFAPMSGKVTRQGGAPAAGILVCADGVGDAYPAGSSRARTAADGSYKMELPPNQSYTVYVDDTEWAAASRTGIVVREGKPHAGVDLSLEPGSVIHGRVTAGPLSEPAPGVTLMLHEQGPAVPVGTLVNQPAALLNAAMRVADTDSDGRYSFRVGPGDYRLTGPRSPDAAGDPAPSEPLKVGGGQEFVRDFELPRQLRPLRFLRGVVRAEKPDGRPIAGAIVVAEPIGARISPTHGFADVAGGFAALPAVRKSHGLRTRSGSEILRGLRRWTQTTTPSSPWWRSPPRLPAGGSSMKRVSLVKESASTMRSSFRSSTQGTKLCDGAAGDPRLE